MWAQNVMPSRVRWESCRLNAPRYSRRYDADWAEEEDEGVEGVVMAKGKFARILLMVVDATLVQSMTSLL